MGAGQSLAHKFCIPGCPGRFAIEYQQLASITGSLVAFHRIWRVARHPDLSLPANGLTSTTSADQMAHLWIHAHHLAASLPGIRCAAFSWSQWTGLALACWPGATFPILLSAHSVLYWHRAPALPSMEY